MVFKNRVKTGKILSQIFWDAEKCAEFMTEHHILKENVIHIHQEGDRLTLIYEEVVYLEDPRIKLYYKKMEEQNG